MSQKAKPAASSKSKKGAGTAKTKEGDAATPPAANTTPQQVPMGSMGPVMPKHPDLQCPHLSFVKLEKMKRKILTPTAWSCSECGTTEGVWACLTCGKIGCGRYQSEHALSHYEDYKHPLALEINLSYCYCYQCEEYVTHDNKKEDLETIRKLLLKAQIVDEHASTTRSGKAIRAPVKIPTSNEFKDEDRLHTAVKHWRLLSLGKAFNTWKDFIFDQRRKRQLEQINASPIPSSASPAIMSPATPPPPPRTKTSFLTQSTQRALASPGASRRIIPGITGLRNLGNTCFMNTVLQALSNTSEFRDFFVHMLGATSVPQEGEGENGTEKEKGKAAPKAKAKGSKGKGKEKEAEDADSDVYGVIFNGKKYTRQPTLDLLDTIRKHVPKLEEVSLAMEVHSLLRVLWSGKWAVVTPCALLESVWKFVPKFRNRQQQDAQEFLCYLFDRLQLELQHANSALGPPPAPAPTTPMPSSSRSSTRSRKPAAAAETETKQTDEEKTPAKANGRRKRERSPSPSPTLPPVPLSGDQATIITDTFQGKLSSKVTCSGCNHTSTKLDPFLDLSVDIPVVSIAKPHRRRRKTPSKPKAKTKAKTKQNGIKAEDPPDPSTESPPSSPAPAASTDETSAMDTTADTDTSTHTDTESTTETTKETTTAMKLEDKTDTNNATTTSDEAKKEEAVPVTPASDSDNEHGPATCHLSDCITSFMKAETVEGYSCGECNGKHDATKRLYLHSLPHVLCIVLKRFSWTSTSRAKIDTHVTIPFTLDLSTFIEPTTPPKKEPTTASLSLSSSVDTTKDKDKAKEKAEPEIMTTEKDGIFELRSIVMHHGLGLLSGHYTSYCYNELQDTWVHYNDARVQLVTREQVEREAPSQAYLMFYQRVSPSLPPFYPPMFPLIPTRPLDNSPPPSPYNPPPAPTPPSSTSNETTAANSKAKRPRTVR